MGYQSVEIKKIFQKSVDLVKEAILESKSKREIKIVGSFGPYASFDPKASEYVGEYDSTDDEIMNFKTPPTTKRSDGFIAKGPLPDAVINNGHIMFGKDKGKTLAEILDDLSP